ncbi:MAG: DinB family protein, partial [Phycisphaerales bacterium]|nr:DinB family protein [Phycisphaerales bacterium]
MSHGECCGGTGACRTKTDREPRLHEDLIVRYLRGVENFDPRVFDLTDEQTDEAFPRDAGAGLWPVRVLMGHLADAELVYTHRIRRTIAEDSPVLALWDEMAFVDGGLYGAELRPPVAGFVAAIHTMRRWTAELLISLTPEQWDRRAMHPERGEITVLQMVETAAKHLEHHNQYLQR